MLTFYDSIAREASKALYLDRASRELASDWDHRAAFVEAAARLVRRLRKEKRP